MPPITADKGNDEKIITTAATTIINPSNNNNNNNNDNNSISSAQLPIFPGYEAQPSDDGIKHSLQKLEIAARDLSKCLDNLSSHNVDHCNDDGISGYGAKEIIKRNNEERFKKEEGGEEITTATNNVIHLLPCQTNEETLNYRCACTFQMIPFISHKEEEQQKSDSNANEEDIYPLQYAMRQSDIGPVPIHSSSFGIATPRIQHTMALLLNLLNETENAAPNDEGRIYLHSKLRSNLTSVSFTSSWDGVSSCLVTLHYSQPLLRPSSEKDEAEDWKNELKKVCQRCNIDTLTCRAKKQKIVVGNDPGVISDTVKIIFMDDENKNGNMPPLIKASLCPPKKNIHDNNEENTENNKNVQKSVSIKYQKPEIAFQHPNGKTMLHALQWILTRCALITQTTTTTTTITNKEKKTLLEMYCGCGAHTLPISKCGFFEKIVAVELDGRLVDSCKHNCLINDCLGANGEKSNCTAYSVEDGSVETISTTPVHVFQGDAGEWARKSLHANYRREQHQKKKKQTTTSSLSSWYNQNYDVLLVDPPRQGLDEKVCHMALSGTFTDIIYISCGRHALLKDLERLCCCSDSDDGKNGSSGDRDCFEVVDCTLFDLFPRTKDSVESLVHLRRDLRKRV